MNGYRLTLGACAKLTIIGQEMSVLVVGTVAYDTVVTPAGSRESALGGSATYFSLAGSYFAPISVVAVVGEDFRAEDRELLGMG